MSSTTASVSSARRRVKYGSPTRPRGTARDSARLLEASALAGFPETVLVPEPVAAALSYWHRGDAPAHGFVAIYDLGGGTFDTAVLQATDDGFSIVGRPDGDSSVGGELFDEIVANLVGSKLDPWSWEQIQLTSEPAWRQVGNVLRNEARRLKETLSTYPYAEALIPLPSGLVRVRVDRLEFEGAVTSHIEDSVLLLRRCVAEAGVNASALTAIQLAGGSSRIPLIEHVLQREFPGVAVHRRGDPKEAVVLGALVAASTSLTPAPTNYGSSEPQTHRSPPTVASSPAQWPAPSGTPPAPPDRSPSTRSSGRGRRVAVIVGASLALLAGGGVLLATQDDDSDQSATTDTTAHVTLVAPTDDSSPAATTTPTPTASIDTTLATTIVSPPTVTTVLVGGAELSPISTPAAPDRVFTGDTSYVYGLAMTPDGSRIASGGDEFTVQMWDTTTGQQVGPTWQGHKGDINGIVLSDDTSRAITASSDGSLRLWNAATGETLAETTDEFLSPVLDVVYTADRSLVLAALGNGTLQFFDATTLAESGAAIAAHDGLALSVAVSRDGRFFASGGLDGAVRLWDAVTRQPIGSPMLGHVENVNSVAFSPDGAMLASSGDDGTVRFWDVTTGAQLGEPLAVSDQFLQGLTYSADGTVLAIGTAQDAVALWDPVARTPLGPPIAAQGVVTRVALSTDATFMATVGWDEEILFWRLRP